MHISVCMATYNGEKYIEEQIASILSQLGSKDELVISDDMSIDNTIKIIKSFKDTRIKIYEHQDNHGFVKNFENALIHSTGDFIFLSDQDDIWFENKVTETMKKLKNYDFVVSDCITIGKNKKVISKSRIEQFNIKEGFVRELIKNRYLGCCMAFNRKVLNTALPFPANVDLVEHDTWLASVASLYFKFYLLDEPLIYYRRHENNVSDGGFSKGFSIGNKIYRRLYRLYYLLKIREPRGKHNEY